MIAQETEVVEMPTTHRTDHAYSDHSENASAHLREGQPQAPSASDYLRMTGGGPLLEPAQITDGLSTTMVIGDRHIPPAISGAGVMEHYNQGDTAVFVSDTPHTLFRDTARGLASSPLDTNNRKFGSLHPGVTQFVMCDGHVEALSNDMDIDVLLKYAAIGDGDDPSDIDEGDGT